MAQSHQHNVSTRFQSFRQSWIFLALLIAALLPFGAGLARAAGPAALVKDINPNSLRYPPPSLPAPAFLVTSGNQVFFQGYNINNGYELWSSDGTTAGTQIVRDTDPGLTDSFLHDLTDVNGTLFFVSNEASRAAMLWKSDGTAVGTVLVAGNGIDGPFDIYNLTNVNGTLFFTARGQTGRLSLWKTDGTTAGTVVLADPFPTGNSAISNLTAVGNKLFFVATDAVHGRELWQSNGTPAGTAIVKDINPAGDSFDGTQSPELTAVGSKLFFITASSPAGGLWQSDGTATGTTQVTAALPFGAAELENVNGTLFFSGSRNDPSNGPISGLWKSDGTSAGTTPVKDLGTNNLPLSNLKGIGSRLFFAGTGDKLWISDGTASGTVQVADVTVGGFNYLPSFTNVGGLAFFAGKDSAGDIELWKSDGTNGGTARVKDINTTGSSSPVYFAAQGNTLLFSADDGQGTALWKSAGSDADTTLVKDPARTASGIDAAHAYLPPLSLENVVINDKLFFIPDDGVVLPEDLWLSDGTADGTKLLKHMNAGTMNQYSPTEHNGKLFFIGVEATATSLWQSDGTMLGTTVVKSFAGDTLKLSNHTLISTANGLFFFMGNASGYTLWKSDGSAAGTTKVADLPQDSTQPSALTNVNGRLFFIASDSTHGREVWTSDGTAAGTHLLKEIRPFFDSPDPFGLTNFNGTLFFMVRMGTDSGYELWKSDGSLAGTVRVKSLGYGLAGGGPSPADLTVVGSQLFFSAYDTDAGDELWVSDGTEIGTRRVKDINTLANISIPFSNNHGSSPLSLANVGGILLFSADDGVHGPELWRSDGTEAGTTLLKDLNPGPVGSGIGGIKQMSTSKWALFAASDGPSGIELWKTDGSAVGTAQVQDVALGAGSSNPVAFTASGARCFFFADDGSTGTELWSLGSASLSGALNNKLLLPMLRR